MTDSTTPRATAHAVSAALARRHRWRWPEIAFWVLAVATIVLLPRHHLLLNEIAILGLFALSLDLLLGYAGIISLGQAAFLGLGAYGAGLIAKQGIGEPLVGLLGGIALSAAAGFVTSFLVLRGSDLTRLMVTLGVALIFGEIANQAAGLTGGADGLQGIAMGPVLGLFDFDLFGTTAYAYSLAVLFLLMLLARRIVHSPYGLSLTAIRDNPLRASAVGVRINRRLVAVYTLAAAYAGAAGALLTQTTAFVSVDIFEFHRSAEVLLMLIIGGTGYLYGGLIGAAVFKILQDVLSAWTPEYWQFWIGLLLVALVITGRGRLLTRYIPGLKGKETRP